MAARRPLVLSVLALAIVVGIGVAGYGGIEGRRFLDATWDAMWTVVITLTTIGFGQVHPTGDPGRIVTPILVLAGVSIGAYAMSQITRLVLEGTMTGAVAARRRKHMLDSLRNHFIVVGYGRLGETIAEELRASGVAVCVIERRPELVAVLETRGQFPVVVGDGSNDDVLRAAGVERARGLAVAVASSAEAVFVTLSARVLNPEINIVTRVSDAEHALKARRAGATSVVSPHTMGGWRMAHGLVRPHATSFLDLATLSSHADILMEEYAIPAGSDLAGRSLGELRVGERFGVLVVAIRRADGRMVAVPRAAEVLVAGDVLIVIGAPDPVRAIGGMLQATA